MENALNIQGVFYFQSMTTFIDEVISDLLEASPSLTQTVVVLPSRRAGNFFLQSLQQQLGDTVCFLPQVISIEELVEEILLCTYKLTISADISSEIQKNFEIRMYLLIQLQQIRQRDKKLFLYGRYFRRQGRGICSD